MSRKAIHNNAKAQEIAVRQQGGNNMERSERNVARLHKSTGRCKTR